MLDIFNLIGDMRLLLLQINILSTREKEMRLFVYVPSPFRSSGAHVMTAQQEKYFN
jgi:hypothetical protein